MLKNGRVPEGKRKLEAIFPEGIPDRIETRLKGFGGVAQVRPLVRVVGARAAIHRRIMWLGRLRRFVSRSFDGQ